LPAFAEAALRCAFSHDDKLVIGGDWLGNVKLWTAADAKAEAKEVRSLAANPPTLEMRLSGAKTDLAAKQRAAEIANRELDAARTLAAKKAKASDAARAAFESLLAAKK